MSIDGINTAKRQPILKGLNHFISGLQHLCVYFLLGNSWLPRTLQDKLMGSGYSPAFPMQRLFEQGALNDVRSAATRDYGSIEVMAQRSMV
jgi:hypothetical protein